MKNMILSLFSLIFLAILIITACSPTSTTTAVPIAASDTPFPPPSDTPFPEPLATPIPTNTRIPTDTATPTPSPDYSQIYLIRTFAVYEQSSQVFLNIGSLTGEYYAIGRYGGLGNIYFQCTNNLEQLNEIVCNGGSIPFGLRIYFNLYDAETNELVYNNMVSFTGPIPSPVGVVCEAEPLWESNQGDLGCWAITCYLNGSWYGGTGNTCFKPWPFEWEYTYP